MAVDKFDLFFKFQQIHHINEGEIFMFNSLLTDKTVKATAAIINPPITTSW